MKFWIPPTFHFKKTLGLKLPAFNCALAAFSEGFGSWIKTWSKQQLTRFTWFHFTHGKTSKHYLKITRVCAADTLDMFGCLCLSRSSPRTPQCHFSAQVVPSCTLSWPSGINGFHFGIGPSRSLLRSWSRPATDCLQCLQPISFSDTVTHLTACKKTQKDPFLTNWGVSTE